MREALRQRRGGAPIRGQPRRGRPSPRYPARELTLARYLIRAGKRGEARNQLDALARLGECFAAQDEVRKLRASL